MALISNITHFQQFLLIGLILFLSADQYIGFQLFHQPIMASFLLSVIFGNLELGLASGLSLQFIALGSASVGGVQPPNYLVSTLLTGILAFAFPHLPYEVFIIISLPFAWMAPKLIQVVFKHNHHLVKQLETEIENNHPQSIQWIHPLGMVKGALAFLMYMSMSLWILITLGEAYSMLLPEELVRTFVLMADLLKWVGIALIFKILYQEKLKWMSGGLVLIYMILFRTLTWNIAFILSLSLALLSVFMVETLERKKTESTVPEDGI